MKSGCNNSSSMSEPQRDIRDAGLFREAQDLYRATRQPGTGRIVDAAEASTNGTQVAFAGTVVEMLEELPPTRICSTELITGATRVLTFGPNIDRLPRFSH